MKKRVTWIVFLLILVFRGAAQTLKFEVNWAEYLNSISGNQEQKEVQYQCQKIVGYNQYRVDTLVSQIEWAEINDSTEIQKISGISVFSELQVETFSASNELVVLCSLHPFKNEADKWFRVVRFSVILEPRAEEKQTLLTAVTKKSSILANGKWIKISVSDKGIYKITYDQLKTWGITAPESVAIYGNGGKELPKKNNEAYPDDPVLNRVIHGLDSDGKQAVFFYAQGTSSLYYDETSKRIAHTVNSFSDLSYYYLTCESEKSPLVPVAELYSGTPDVTNTTYDAYSFIEEETNSPMKSGRKLYGDIFKTSGRNSYQIDINNVLTDQAATLTIAGAGRSSEATRFEVYINGTYKDKLDFSAVETTSKYALYASHAQKSISFMPNNSTEIQVGYVTGSAGGEAWLDFISVNAKASLSFSGQTLNFRNSTDLGYDGVKYQLVGFPSTGLVWDVTQPLEPELVFSATAQQAGTISFAVQGRTLREFVAFNPAGTGIGVPNYVEEVSNQDIKGNDVPDMIIVTHPDFSVAANKMANHRRNNDGLSVLVLTTTQIYNEFSGGIADVASIRNMVRYFYQRSLAGENQLQFLLLMGDGLYNNRSAKSFIPTYQSENSLHQSWSYVTDDFFGLLDDNEGESAGYLDIGVGRITCKTESEADIIVSKIIGYDSSESRGVWRNKICFIADDEDGNIHMSDTEKLIDTVKAKYPGFYTDKIYLDAYQQVVSSGENTYPEVTEAINRRVKEGVLILNYVGHANSSSLAHENILEINDITAWSNSFNLPVFVTATCEFSQFDGDKNSAGEEILSNPTGGGVALFTTTRVVYSNANYNLSNNFYQSIFELDSHGDKLRLGEVMRRAKNRTTNDTNKLSFTLLADPSMRLAFPKYSVRTTAINGVPVEQGTITAGALEKVTIQGEVTDQDGIRLNDFNGEVTTMLYDKEMTIETYANDGGYPFKFNVQNNLIYKGISTVSQGVFELSFYVPKDISYQIGPGRIYYYAVNETEDANGSCDHILIGGTGANPVVENNPPDIQIFLNDESFEPYGKVASSALLLVKLYDETGINTVGAGIGHDLIGVLDGDYANQFVLNDYYTSKSNSFQEGTVLYPLSNLSPGEHTILIKAWDVQNNSTEKEVHFVVENGFKVFSVNNYPNPVTSTTKFTIKHNLPGEVFEANIDIFALNGQKVYTINQSVASSGGVISQIKWDTEQLTQPLKQNQLLVYRILLTSTSGEQAMGAGKLFLKKQGQ